MVKACKAINKAFTTLRNIETMEDLKKAKLSLSDFQIAKDIFKELSTPGSTTKTFFGNVAAFYEKCDFLVIEKNGYFVIWTEA